VKYTIIVSVVFPLQDRVSFNLLPTQIRRNVSKDNDQDEKGDASDLPDFNITNITCDCELIYFRTQINIVKIMLLTFFIQHFLRLERRRFKLTKSGSLVSKVSKLTEQVLLKDPLLTSVVSIMHRYSY
jgi:hypothetical protein